MSSMAPMGGFAATRVLWDTPSTITTAATLKPDVTGVVETPLRAGRSTSAGILRRTTFSLPSAKVQEPNDARTMSLRKPQPSLLGLS